MIPAIYNNERSNIIDHNTNPDGLGSADCQQVLLQLNIEVWAFINTPDHDTNQLNKDGEYYG